MGGKDVETWQVIMFVVFLLFWGANQLDLRTVVFVFVQLAKPLAIHSLLFVVETTTSHSKTFSGAAAVDGYLHRSRGIESLLDSKLSGRCRWSDSCEGWWCRIHKFGWVFTHHWTGPNFGGRSKHDKQMQMYGKFQGFRDFPLTVHCLDWCHIMSHGCC